VWSIGDGAVEKAKKVLGGLRYIFHVDHQNHEVRESVFGLDMYGLIAQFDQLCDGTIFLSGSPSRLLRHGVSLSAQSDPVRCHAAPDWPSLSIKTSLVNHFMRYWAPEMAKNSPYPILCILVLHVFRLPPFRLRPLASSLVRYVRSGNSFCNRLVDDSQGDLEVDLGGICLPSDIVIYQQNSTHSRKEARETDQGL